LARFLYVFYSPKAASTKDKAGHMQITTIRFNDLSAEPPKENEMMVT